MGAVIARWRKAPSTIDVLEKIDKDIDAIEKTKRGNLEQQRKIIGSLLVSSVLLYIICTLVFYFYYFPDNWKERVKYSSPLLAFPFLIYVIKRFLHWYFVKRISRNESALDDLRDSKRKILEEVMEKETYKKAKEILDKFDPDRNKQQQPTQEHTGKVVTGKEGQRDNLRKRAVAGSMAQSNNTPGQQSPQGSLGAAQSPQFYRNGQQQFGAGPTIRPPGPPMPRPVLPRERSLGEKFMEVFIGDGPQNRYALICKECHSHNGMALREEFEFLSFRCCYCFTFNEARRQKPRAPTIELTPRKIEERHQSDDQLTDDSLISNDNGDSEDDATEKVQQSQHQDDHKKTL